MGDWLFIATTIVLVLYATFILNKKTYENVLLVYWAFTVIFGWLFFDIIKNKNWYVYAVFFLVISFGFMCYQLVTKKKTYFIINFSVEEENHFDELNDILKSFCRRNNIDKFYIELSVDDPGIITFHKINKVLVDACMIEVTEYASNNLTEPKKNGQILRKVFNILIFAFYTFLIIKAS